MRFDLTSRTYYTLAGKITGMVSEPWKLPGNEKERDAVIRMKNLVELLKKRKRI
jgi:hypothetical protein